MDSMRSLAALLAILPGALAAAPAAVDVSFGDLSKFSDLRLSVMTTDRDRQGLADELKRHVEREALSHLPPDSRLSVKITDVDMAGEYPPITGPMSSDLRVIREVYPPRIDLEFTLAGADGRTLRDGRRELRDAGFLWGVSPGNRDTLAFEKALLERWLRREFAPAR
jgi:hypothetical protein